MFDRITQVVPPLWLLIGVGLVVGVVLGVGATLLALRVALHGVRW